MAENGVTGIFMVSSVMAIPMVGKLKRDQEQAYKFGFGSDGSVNSFAHALEQAMEEAVTAAAPTECYTVTYGRDSRIKHFQYHTREYHY